MSLGAAYFKDLFPFNQMTAQTVDGQQMIYLPKMYVKTGTIDAGAQRAGKPGFWISERPQDGYHLYPAFYNNGVEAQGLQLAVDLASKGSDGKPESKAGATPWVNEPTFNNIKSLAARRNTGTGEQSGWHAWNIYEHHLLARLMMIEYGTSDMQASLGTQNVNYHGILNPWGNPTAGVGFLIDGLLADGSNNIQIADNTGKGTLVSTGKAFPGSGWITSTWMDKGALYDLSDVFLAKTVDSTEGNGTFSDYAGLYAGCAFCTSDSTSSYYGPFCLNRVSPGSTNGNLGFRLARYVM